jgi:hypothetical protein
MAYYFITASKDATIYLQQPNQNTGLDQILEISKVYYGNIKDVTRTLIKFELGNLNQLVSDNSIQLDEVVMILHDTESEEIPLGYSVYAYPISGSWDMGIGNRFDDISTAGVTWRYREGDSKSEWSDIMVTGSLSSNPNDGRGGVWYNTISASQQFFYESARIEMPIGNLVTEWLSGSLSNDGLILKYSNEFENDTADYGILKFFSKETHTIYQPKLRIGWDDQIFETGSLLPVQATDYDMRIGGFKKHYKVNTNIRLRIIGRDKYPLKTFVNPFPYDDVKYLPSETYYRISDFVSGDIIIPFSQYSKVSCSPTGNYINLNLTNWEVNRVYKIEFKIIVDGAEYHFDNDYTFNVVRD